MNNIRGFLFTDLDGTLLDHESYEWKPARTGLEWCRMENVEVVLCSSKTWEEVRQWRNILDLDSPAIIENGGGLVLESDHTYAHEPGQRAAGGFRFVELGKRAEQILNEFRQIRDQGDFKAKTILDMSPETFSVKTGLSVEEAEKALKRDHTVPVQFMGNETRKQEFISWCVGSDITVQEGGRFLHLQRDCDKGKAVQWLMNRYSEAHEDVPTGGIGDSQNDISMLQEVDHPYAVKKPDGEHDERIAEQVEDVNLIEEIGPDGWTPAAENFLDILDEIQGRVPEESKE